MSTPTAKEPSRKHVEGAGTATAVRRAEPLDGTKAKFTEPEAVISTAFGTSVPLTSRTAPPETLSRSPRSGVEVHELRGHGREVAEHVVVVAGDAARHGVGEGRQAVVAAMDLRGGAAVHQPHDVQRDHVREGLHVASYDALHAQVHRHRARGNEHDEQQGDHRDDGPPLIAPGRH